MKTPDINYSLNANLPGLLEELFRLRDSIKQNALVRLGAFRPFYPEGKFSESAQNLAHYLAFRQYDLRPLQEKLASVGLSSLGRGESHTLLNLESVIRMLGKANDIPLLSLDTGHEEKFSRGRDLLEHNTIKLFGETGEQRKVRIMVTLSTEAATDYELVRNLLEKGMNCARINCAHDDQYDWTSMIDHIRRAEKEIGKSCKIYMDLAGHKIRTGPLQSDPAILHLKTKRDHYGRELAPYRLLIGNDEVSKNRKINSSKAQLTSAKCILIHGPDHKRLQTGDRLHFIDCRNKRRFLEIIERKNDAYWLAEGRHNAYLDANTIFTLERINEHGDYVQAGSICQIPFQGKPATIRLFLGDRLLLTRHNEPGSPAKHDPDRMQLSIATIGCSYPEVIDKLAPGDPVWIDDGKLGTVVESVSQQGALLKVTEAGEKGVRVRSDKGLNFPETELQLPALSEKDKKDLDFVSQHADIVGFSFVQSLNDMDCLMKELNHRGTPDLPVIAKIETQTAVKNIPEIILGTIGRHTLGIMIARGDLAVELGSVRMSEIQEEILWVCEAGHVPVVWATQVLESLAKKGTISRPEITDAAMSVRAECVMLNKGPYILEALRILDNILIRMQAHHQKKMPQLRALHW